MSISKIPSNLNQAIEKGREKFLAKYSDEELTRMARAYDIEKVWLNSLIIKNQELAQCDPVSMREVLGATVTSGLTLSPAFNEAYIIPYGKTAQLQISYVGMIKLLTDSGSVSNVEAHVIYENDFFEYELGLEKKFKHIPVLKNRGEMIAVYAIAHIRGAQPQLELLTADDVEAVKNRSKTAHKPGSPWQSFPAQMWRKTAVKRLFKYLPKTNLSDELLTALSSDYAAEVQPIEIEATEEPNTQTATIFAAPEQVQPPAEKPKRGRPRKNPAPATTQQTPMATMPEIPARKTIPPKVVNMPTEMPQPNEPPRTMDIFTNDYSTADKAPF